MSHGNGRAGVAMLTIPDWRNKARAVPLTAVVPKRRFWPRPHTLGENHAHPSGRH